MRRPMVFILLAYAGGITAGFVFKGDGLIPVGGLVFILMLLLTAAPNLKKGWLRPFLLVFFLGYLYLNLYSADADPFEQFDRKQVTIVGHVISTQEQYEDYFKLEVAGEAFDNEGQRKNFNARILVNLKGSLDYVDGMTSIDGKLVYADLAGKPIRLTGIIARPPASKNPHLFDYKLYLKTRNISTVLESNSWQCTLLPGRVNGLTNALSRYKYGLMERLQKNMTPETFGLMAGILFGDKNFIDDSIYQTFQKNGTAHILSVSGIHVGIIYAYIDKVVGKGKHPLYNVITVGLLMIYAALSGFSPSVDRAVFMIIIFIIGKLMQERYDLTTCTAFSAFVLLLYNPYNLLNLGFQLSYIAVFILAVILPWLSKFTGRLLAEKKEDLSAGSKIQKKEKMLTKAVRMMVPLIAIQIGMIPITAYIFNYFSLSAFIANVPVILLAGIILPIGLILMLISPILEFCSNPMLINHGVDSILREMGSVMDFLFSLFATSAELLIWVMIELNKLTAIRGIGYFDIQNPSMMTLILYYIMIFLCCSELGQWYFKKGKIFENSTLHKKEKVIVSLVLIFLLMLCILISDDEFGDAELIFIDVGQGDCLHIRTPLGKNILIDGGGTRELESGGSGYDVGGKVLLPYFLKNGVSKIDMAFVSHLHDDHYKGIVSLAQVMKIDKVILYSGNKPRQKDLVSSLNIDDNGLIYVQKGDRIRIEPGIYIDILYPDYQGTISNQEADKQEKSDDENAMNLLLRLNYNGLTVMMTGDLSGEDEAKILEEGLNLKADILKVPHHGSRYSSSEAFIESVDPTFAIIQVGKNNFGHPNPGIIENYAKKGIIVFRTDRDGAVLVDIEKNKTARTMTMLDRHWETVKL